MAAGDAAEAERLRELVALHEASAALHAAHAARLGQLAERDHARLVALRRSLSWRLTWPLRAAARLGRAALRPRRSAGALLRRLRGHRLRARLRRVLREEGVRVTLAKTVRLLRNLALHAAGYVAVRLAGSEDRLRHRRRVAAIWLRGLGIRAARLRLDLPRPARTTTIESVAPPVPAEAPSGAVAPVTPAALFAPSVLIVGELSLPQCAKYRVWQKREHLLSLGVACTVRDWTDIEAVRAALQLCAMVIFYRVPGHPPVLDLYREARRLGLAVVWEVDDLIFDERLYLADRDLARLDPEIRRGVLAGAALYDRALRGADRGIASTAALAALMRATGLAQVDVIENALDDDTISAAEALLAVPRPIPALGDPVRIVYGSGSRTHDGDFAIAAPALAEIMTRHPQVHLRIVGELSVPATLKAFGDRVEHLPARRYRDYLALLSRADINLAPLEDTPFNGAKSNIKFVEAGILAIPSICSPSANFAAAIEHGVDGLLPRDTAGWIGALERLVADPADRVRMGRAARARVLDRYAPARIAASQLGPLVAPLRAARGADSAQGRLRVLAVHRHLYPPRPDGAVGLARRAIETLAARADTALAVFTAEDLADTPPYALRRLTGRAVPVVAMRPPRRADPVLAQDDPAAARRFAEVLDAMRPDTVWFDSLRGLGAGLARLCTERGIAYVLDLADPWWHPPAAPPAEPASHDAVAPLDPALGLAIARGALRNAARLLAPNATIAVAAIAAGAPADRVAILPRGVDTPRAAAGPETPALRFGYAGTEEGELVLRCFSQWDTEAAALHLVDHARTEGRRALLPAGRAAKRCSVAPPFDDAGRDAFFAGIDVLLYLGTDPLASAQIVREALARGVWVAACLGPELPQAATLTRFDGGAFADPAGEGAAAALRAALAPLPPQRDAIRAARRAHGMDRVGDTVFADPAQQAAALRAMLEQCAR